MRRGENDGIINPWGNVGGSPSKTPGVEFGGMRNLAKWTLTIAEAVLVSLTAGGALYNRTET